MNFTQHSDASASVCTSPRASEINFVTYLVPVSLFKMGVLQWMLLSNQPTHLDFQGFPNVFIFCGFFDEFNH